MRRTFKTCVIFQIIFASNCRAFIALDTSPFQYHRKSYFTFEVAAIENDVQVISNVFSTSACELLHDLSEQHNQRTNDGSSIFIRPPRNDLPLTPIENAIDSFLTQLGDTSQKVEYWSRSEYMNIDVHADIDEQHLKDSGEVRCPKNGHVLYLKVKKNLRGPTCVFPHQRKQWRNNDDLSENILLITVPAVEGRILRFPGSAMHAVPKPFYRWLLDKEEVKKLVQDEECEEIDVVDDEWNEEDNDYLEDENIERSVLLFNTWYDDEEGPKAVNGDYATGALPEGIELSEEDVKAFLQTEQSKLLKEWENSFGKHNKKVQCKPKSHWIMEDFENSTRDVTDAKINVSLMGDSKRHSYHSKFATLEGNANILEKALGEVSNVSEVYLSIPKERE
jgi:hypothetical protein